MKSKIMIFFYSVLILVVAAALYISYFKFELSEYITEDTDMILYFKPEKITAFIGGGKESETDNFAIEKIFKNAFLLHRKAENKNSYTYIIAADAGYNYPIVMTYFMRYFKKNNNGFYTIRSGDDIPDNIRSVFAGLKFFTDKGLFVLSKSEEELLSYRNKIENRKFDKDFNKFYINNKNKDFIMKIKTINYFGDNVQSSYMNGITDLNAFADIDYKNKKIIFNVKQYGTGEIFNLTSVSNVGKREIGANIADGDFYIANNDFGKVFKIVLDTIGKKSNENYFDKIEEVFGFSLEEMFDLLGNEIVFNNRNYLYSGVLTLKDEKKAKVYFRELEQNDNIYNFEGLKFIVEDGKLFAGEEISEVEIPKEIEEGTFLYIKGELSRIYGLKDYKGIFAEVTLKNKEKYIEADIIFEKEEFKKVIKKLYREGLENIFGEEN